MSSIKWSLLVVLCLVTTGCREDPRQSATARRLKGIATVYLDYTAARGQSPATEAELLGHLQSLPSFVVEANHLSGAADAQQLCSDRDSKPLQLRYGVALGRIGSEDAPLIAYEQDGKDGQHLVVYANTTVDCISQSQLQQALGEAP